MSINPKVKQYLEFKGKIDTFAVFDELGVTPHQGQRELLSAYESKIPATEDTIIRGKQIGVDLDFEYEYDTLVVAAGRRWGKSYGISAIATGELLIPHANVLLASYTLENCEIIFKQVVEFIKKLGIEIRRELSKDKVLELINGARISVGAVQNIESKLGNYVTLLLLDEAKKFDKTLYEQVLIPMLADVSPMGRSILISSPDNSWFKTYYDYGQSLDTRFKKIFSINSPTSQNPAIPKSWIEHARNTLPPDVFEQEIEGKFTASAGLVYPEFNKERNVRKLSDYPHFWDWIYAGEIVVNSIDPGYSHHFASVHFVYITEINTYLVFGCYSQNKLVTEVHSENIKEFESSFIEREADIRYCDPASAQTIADFSAYDLHYNKAEKPTRETVILLNQLLWQTSKVTGEARLIFLEDCDGVPELIRQISSVKWKEGADAQTKESSTKTAVKPFGPDRDRRTDWDAMDALRYGLFSYEQQNGNQVSMIELDSAADSDLSADDELMYSAGWVKMG